VTVASDQATTNARPPSGASSRAQRERRTQLYVIGLRLLIIVVLAGSWQAVVDGGLLEPLFVSKPTAIVAALYHGLAGGQLLGALGTTLAETLIGFAIALGAATVSALLLLESPLLQRTMSPFITAANNIPRLVLAPLFVLWFGIGTLSRVAFIVTIVYFILLINIYAGLQNADRDHLILAKVAGAGRWRTFVQFRLPSSLPTVFAGIQLGLAFAFIGAVIAETLNGGAGLGAQLSTYAATFATADTFADILLMALVATALSGLMKLIEHFVLSWRRIELRAVSKS
jgi:NitT/TauT family transport system permease protein